MCLQGGDPREGLYCRRALLLEEREDHWLLELEHGEALETQEQYLALPRTGRGFGLRERSLIWELKSNLEESLGRTKKLRRAYRSTREIMLAAHSVLDLIGRVDEGAAEDFLQPDYGAMAPGQPPMHIEARDRQDALERLVSEVTALGASVPGRPVVDSQRTAGGRALVMELEKALGPGRVWLVSIKVCSRTNNFIRNAFRRSIAPFGAWDLNCDEPKKEPPRGSGRDYLRVARLETATGLEAGAVLLLGLEELLNTLEPRMWPGTAESRFGQ